MMVGGKRLLKEEDYSSELSDVPDEKRQFVGDYDSENNSDSRSDRAKDDSDDTPDGNIGAALHEPDVVDVVSPWYKLS